MPPKLASSEFVTEQNFPELSLPAVDHAALAQKVTARLRLLRLVLERKPKHFTPYKSEPAYKLTYYLETLECGHQQFYFPQAGPMTKRRHCAKCAFAASLPEKKPAVSVPAGIETQRKKSA